MKKLLATLFTAGVVFSAHAADYNANGMFNSTATEEAANTPAGQVSDSRIAQQVRDVLAGGWFSKGFETVTFNVNSGNVVLTGTVPSEEDKAKIEASIKKIDGVQSLNSQVMVKDTGNLTSGKMSTFSQDKFVTPTDKQLNSKIHDAINYNNLASNFSNVKLNTNNGIVRLEGSVPSSQDQQTLIETIRKVDGVKSVTSNLNINQ